MINYELSYQYILSVAYAMHKRVNFTFLSLNHWKINLSTLGIDKRLMIIQRPINDNCQQL